MILTLLIAIVIDGTIILALAYVLARSLKSASASLRHNLLLGALVAMLILPVVSMFAPTWHVPIIRGMPLRKELAPKMRIDVETGRKTTGDALPPVGETAKLREEIPPPRDLIVRRLALVALVLWGAGAVSVLIIQLVRWTGAGFVASMSIRVDSEAQRALFKKVVAEYRIKRAVKLVRSEMAPVTLTWGVVNPCIVLPAESEDWPDDKMEAILRHELAHIKRHDNLLHLISVVACALYWFNPLIWLIARQIDLEREMDCDNYVLKNGTRASDYANHMIEIAAKLSGPKSKRLSPAVMAHNSDIKKRIRSIVDPKINRGHIRRISSVAYVLVVVVLCVPIAAFRPWPADADSSMEHTRVAYDDATPVPTHLLTALENEDYTARSSAVLALAEVEKPQTIRSLVHAAIEAMKDESIYVRLAATNILVKIDDPESVPGLVESCIEAVDDDYSPVRLNATNILVKLRNPESVPGLLEACIKASQDSYHPVRLNAATILRKIARADSLEI